MSRQNGYAKFCPHCGMMVDYIKEAETKKKIRVHLPRVHYFAWLDGRDIIYSDKGEKVKGEVRKDPAPGRKLGYVRHSEVCRKYNPKRKPRPYRSVEFNQLFF